MRKLHRLIALTSLWVGVNTIHAQSLDWAINLTAPSNVEVNALVTDASENVYVTGIFQGTADFDPGAGTANLTAVSGYDMFVAKYDNNGAYLWAISFGSNSSNDEANDIALNPVNGNVVVTGRFFSVVDFDPGAGSAFLIANGNLSDIYCAEYDANGNYVNAFAIGGQDVADRGQAVAVDASGNIILGGTIQGFVDVDPGAGSSFVFPTAVDIFFGKYTSGAGTTLIWANMLNGNQSEDLVDLALDASGDVVITGQNSSTAPGMDFDPGAGTLNIPSAGSWDAYIAKYNNSDGSLDFAVSAVSGVTAAVGQGLALDASDNIYLTGFFAGTVDMDPGAGTQNHTASGSYDVFFGKYTSTGAHDWSMKLGTSLFNYGNSCALDGLGNVYLTGDFSGTVDFDPGAGTANHTASGSNTNAFLACYNASTGAYVNAINIGAAGIESGMDVTCDASNSAIVGGDFEATVDFDPSAATVNLTSGGVKDGFVARYVGCGEPDVPTLDAATICIPGNSTTINITAGDLNDATAWHWYTGSCGGTQISSGVATSLVVSPATTTTYYVRGEGGCASLGSCASITVNVGDVLAPVPDVASLPDLTDECSVSMPTAPTATDDCAGSITGTTSTTFPITTQGTTVVTWTYDDGTNTSTQTQNVIIDDVTAPVPPAVSPVNSQCCVASLPAPTAVDNCDGPVIGTTATSFPICATTTVVWTFTDAEGNSSTVNQTVTVNDNTAPVPDQASLSDLNAQCCVNSATAPTATDNCDGTITGTTTATFPICTSTTITWTYTDGNGNTTNQTQNIVINDVTAPVPDVTPLPDLTDQCCVNSATAPTATDNCDGTITGTTTATFPICSSTTITWTYTDGSGNTTTQTQDIVINDVTAPVPDVTPLSDLTDQCCVMSATAPTATDNCDGSVTGTTTATFPICSSTTITWTYTDAAGNSSTQTQNIVINDVTAPTPDTVPLTALVGQCSVTPNTPTATDNCDGTILGVPDVSFPITSTTTITWTYTDASTNSSTQTQLVTINDNTAPVPDAGSLSPVTNECCIPALTAPTATDNCDGAITGVPDVSFPICVSTTITWTYTDGSGNSSTQTQVVTIDDVTPPVAPASLPDLTDQCCVNSAVAPTANDNCDGTVTGTTTASFPICSSTTITWTFTDADGNSSTQTQDVVINDVTAPAPDVATLSDLTDQCCVNSAVAPTATDNCDGAITGTTTATFPICASTTITWTYIDGSGNTSTQTQNIVINDVTAPVPDVTPLADLTDQCCVMSATAPTATDNCDGTVTGTTTATFPICSSTTITWTYTDAAGNSSTQTQDIVINDVTPPVVDTATLTSLVGQCSVTPNTPTATDNCDGTILGVPDVSFPITSTTTITWTYTDASSNSTTQTQLVTIDDTTDPVPDVASLSDVNAECSATPTTPTATDNCDGSLNGVPDVAFPITTPGTTVVTWTYTDVAGNSFSQTQNVIIDDVTGPAPDVASLSDLLGECSVAAPVSPTATDNCDGPVTGVPDVAFPITTPGTTVVTWTYTDVDGNSTQQTQNVIIDDVTGPAPDVASLSDLLGECSVAAPVSPTATDNCDGPVTGVPDVAFPITTPGTTVVTWTYTDVDGNSTQQTQNVIIDDVTAPVPDVTPLADLTDQCCVMSATAPTATDNCDGTVTGTTIATFPICSSTTITWTYTDAAGNSSTQTQDIVINDVTPPVVDTATLTSLVGQCSVTPNTPTATDNCDGTILGVPDVSFPITATTTITWTYTDAFLNSTTQTQLVTIDDTTDPVPDVASLSDVNEECSATPATPTATDNCDGTINGVPDVAFPITTPGTTVVTWTYTDVAGNSFSQTQNVIIDDVTGPAPDVASLSDLLGECSVAAPVSPTATDNCDGPVTGVPDVAFPITTPGTTVVTWTYTDVDGNSTQQTQNVIIDDVTGPAPDVASLSDLLGECSVAAPVSPTATDNCDGPVTGVPDVAFPITTPGTTVVTWTYTDVDGNSTQQTQNVIINDVTAPVPDAASLGDLTDPCCVNSAVAPTATDNCDGSITGVPDVTFPVCATTTITWTFTDANGNSSTQTQNVIINDAVPPVPDLAVLPDLTGECCVNVSVFPTATDNCSGSVTATTSDALSYCAQGTYTVTWVYTDANGNFTTQDQLIIVDDITAPDTTGPLPVVSGECSVTVSTIPTALDNCEGIISGVPSPGTTFSTLGQHIITWTYDDGNGNVITQNQLVDVQDNTAPVPDLATLPDVTGECCATISTTPTATDNCEGPIVGTTTDALTYCTQGTYTVTWTFDDGNGNVSTQTQTVIVDDLTPPVPDVDPLPVITGECSATVTTAPTATDACSGPVTGTTTQALPITFSTVGTYTVTWTYTDTEGNSSTQDQTVDVIDTTAPVADVATLPDMNTSCTAPMPTAPTATDNCEGTITGVPDVTFPIGTQGTTVVTWTYDDGNGNITTQTQNFNVIDVDAPLPDTTSLTTLVGECCVTVGAAPTATDNCVGTVVGTTSDPLTYCNQGVFTVTWTYDDGNGNVTTQTQTVIVNDVTAPVPDVDPLPAIVTECTAMTPPTPPTATDNCTGSITATPGSATTFPGLGTDTITWIYDDGNGNLTTQIQEVIRIDTTAPVADTTTLTTLTSECAVTISTAPTATDNCMGSVTATSLNGPLPLTFSTQGTHTVVWEYDDGNGNVSQQTQTVLIQDVTPPTFTCPNDTSTCNSSLSYSISPSNVIDNCGNTTISYVITGAGSASGANDASAEFFAPGISVVTYTFQDDVGNADQCSFTVEHIMVDTSVTQNLSTFSSNQNGAIYQWVDCNAGLAPIAGETNQDFTATLNGSYAVIVTFNGCSENSMCFDINNVGLDENPLEGVLVYPNPTAAGVTIDLMGMNGQVTMDVMDATGKMVISGNRVKDDKYYMDMSSWSDGIYMVRLVTDSHYRMIRVVKE